MPNTIRHKRSATASAAPAAASLVAGELAVNTADGRVYTKQDSGTVVDIAQAILATGQTIVAAAGSATAPSVAFTGDTNTGTYSPGADQWAVTTGGTQRLHITSTGDVGIGTAANATVRLNAYQTATNQNGYVTHQVFADPVSTANGAYAHFGAYYILRTDVLAGITDTGAKRGIFASTIRNNKATNNTDAGTLTFLRGAEFQYGHGVQNTAITPTTTAVTGVFLSPLAGYGTITDMYDLYIAGPAHNLGTVGNHYAIYQAGTASRSFFAGNVGIGANRTSPASALDVNGSVTTALGSVSAPALTFTGDSNTGIYSPGADQVGLVTGGVSRLSVNATGVVAIPGTGTSYFQVDASGDVRIGNLAPTNSLRYLDIANSDTGTGSGAIIRLITQNSGGTSNISADIVKYRNGGFYINNNETTAAGFIAFQVGGTEDMRITQAGFVGIGRTAPASALDVNGVITSSAGSAAAPAISFTGDTNTGIFSPGADQLSLVTGGVSRITVAANGLVTTTGDLTCNGTLRTLVGLQSSGGRALFRAVNEAYAVGSAYSATSGAVYFGAANESATPDAQISSAGGGALMYLQNGGNVGIGTTSPSQRLDVNGSVRVAGNISRTGASAATDLGLYSETASNWIRLACNAGDIRFFVDAAAGNQFQGGTAAAILNSAGNFGIGGVTPTCRMDIQATSTIANGTWAGGTDFVRLFAGSGSAFSEQSIAFQESGGNVGARIGVKNQGNGGYDIIFANRDNSSLTSTFAERMRIRATGNVGIGTANPASALEVVGTTTLTGELKTTHYTESVVAIGNSGTTQTLALTSGTVQTCTLTGNCTFTMPTATAGKSFVMLLKTGAGSFTATFTGVKWPGNVAPTITATAAKLEVISFIADGTNWYGNISQNYTP